MNDFQDWVMTLPKQPLTEELKLEILSRANAMLQEEVITIIRNMSTQ